MPKKLSAWSVSMCIVALSATSAWAQAVGGWERARPVGGDPGISTSVVMDRPEFRVLRDYAEPGATRRLHAHPGTTYQVLVVVTGRLIVKVEDESPVDVTAGQVLYLKGAARHTFTNPGTVTATIVEVFGKSPSSGDDADRAAEARALAGGEGVLSALRR